MEEIERYGIRGRFERTTRAGVGWSALGVWRTRAPSRVNAAFFFGVSSRVYDTRVARTTTFVSPELNLPATHRDLQPMVTTRRMIAGGMTGGVMIPITILRALTVAPALRVTTGLITDDPYRVLRTGVRVMWSF